jgi:hypothetical protein
MSLYNALFGANPNSDVLMRILVEAQPKFNPGRFRDIYLNADGSRILLHTRNGGGNREHYEDLTHDQWTDKMRRYCEWDDKTQQWKSLLPNCPYDFDGAHDPVIHEGAECDCTGCIMTYHIPTHPNYVTDYDDDFDYTYATIEFTVPAGFEDEVKAMATGVEPTSVSEKFQHLIADMEAGVDSEDVDRAKKVGEQILGPILAATPTPDTEPEGAENE